MVHVSLHKRLQKIQVVVFQFLYCTVTSLHSKTNIAKEFLTSISPPATGGKGYYSTPNLDDDRLLLSGVVNKKIDEYGNENPGVNGFKPKLMGRTPDRDEQWSKEERTRVGEERFT